MPIHMELRANCDSGEPLRNWDVPKLGDGIDVLCRNFAGQVSIAALSGELVQPTLSVS